MLTSDTARDGRLTVRFTPTLRRRLERVVRASVVPTTLNKFVCEAVADAVIRAEARHARK